MHILLVHQAFAAIDEPGGTRHHELANYLAHRGHQVTIITSGVSYLTGKVIEKDEPSSRQDQQQETGEKPYEQSSNTERLSLMQQRQGKVTILRAYTYSAIHKSFVHRVFSFFSFMVSSFWTGIKVRHVNLVWGTSPPIFQGMTAWVLARFKQVPFVFEVRDLWPAFAIQVGVLRNPVLIRLSTWLEHFLYRHADLVLVNSPGFIEHVKAGGARRIELVPNGADPRMFDPQLDGGDFRKQYSLDDKFIVLYAGAHGLSNDLGVVLQAASQLRNAVQVAIVLLGDGKEKPALQAEAQRLGLENVHFIPPISKLEMRTALAAADVCLAILKPISLYATVYPNKVFDYMAAGRPVLVAIDGVIRKVVEGNKTGLFVPPGDPQALAEKIQWMAEHPQEVQQMGLNGRRLVQEEFDRALLAEKLALIFENFKR